jgi:hypothetical protein
LRAAVGSEHRSENAARPMPSFDWTAGGRSLSLREYAILTTAEVRKHLPDVRAMRKGSTIVWRRGNAVATLNASAADHWRLDAGSSTYHERHDARAAHVAASNIVVHFERRYCRGIDVPPFTIDELARFAHR